MTRSHLIGKLLFVVLGLNVLVRALSSFEYPLWRPAQQGSDLHLGGLFAAICLLAAVCALAWLLLGNSDKWAQLVVGKEQLAPIVADQWVIVGLRLAALLCGLLIIRQSADAVAKVLYFVILGPQLVGDAIVHGRVSEVLPTNLWAWLVVFTKALKVVLGIYLAVGAPGFVKWQFSASREFFRPTPQTTAEIT